MEIIAIRKSFIYKLAIPYKMTIASSLIVLFQVWCLLPDILINLGRGQSNMFCHLKSISFVTYIQHSANLNIIASNYAGALLE